jgi:hypothetical protein
MRKCRSEFGRKIFSILSRNHYDRFAHGAFGFLLAFPIRELLLPFSGIRRGVWSFALPVAIILAVSGWGEEDAERNTRSFERTRYREAFSAHCGCLLCCVLDCTGDPSARSQRLVARKSPRRYIAKGSNGGTARGLTENLTYTGLIAGVAPAI